MGLRLRQTAIRPLQTIGTNDTTNINVPAADVTGSLRLATVAEIKMRACCPSHATPNHCRLRALIALLAVVGGLVPDRLIAQSPLDPTFRVDVDMVMLTFNVLDTRGRSVRGLKPENMQVFEDGKLQKIATFAEGSKIPLALTGDRQDTPGTSVFILLDASNRMYGTLMHACDAIANFVRQLNPPDAVAVYTFGQNMWRSFPLTREHRQPRMALANMVAGSDTAVYNALLLTLRDAAKVSGRKVVILFSNGPDNASVIGPYDVGTVAADEGIPIYIVSTEDAMKDRETAKAFEFLTAHTGGKVHCARTWQGQWKAIAAIQNDIDSSYTIGYYPIFNPNVGFRHIRIEAATDVNKRYRVRVRPGYDAKRIAAAK